MDAKTIAHYTKLPLKEVKRYLTMDARDVFADEAFIEFMHSLDQEYLEQTLPLAREAYNTRLPDVEVSMRARYGLDNTPMSAFTLGNWVVGMLQFPSRGTVLAEMHDRLPPGVIREYLPTFLDALTAMPEGVQEWQQALCLLSFPLMKQR